MSFDQNPLDDIPADKEEYEAWEAAQKTAMPTKIYVVGATPEDCITRAFSTKELAEQYIAQCMAEGGDPRHWYSIYECELDGESRRLLDDNDPRKGN